MSQSHSVRLETGTADGAHRGPALLAYPFRPFFILAGLYAVIVVFGWLGLLFAGWPVGEGMSPLRWHAHELVFGLTSAAIAGFLLTAMCQWTGAKPLRGTGLALLVALWIAGRVAMWSGGVLPGVVIAVIDVAFLVAFGAIAARVIIGAGSRRNLVLLGVLALLVAGNIASHIGMRGDQSTLAVGAEHASIMLVLLLIVIIAGRITPAFTGNWLAQQGRDRRVVRGDARLDLAAIVATAAVIPAAWVTTLPWLMPAVALLAAALNAARLIGWSGWHAARNPLLWVLHVGYAWVVVTLVLRGLEPWSAAITPTVWLHAAGVGAIGTMLLGVMTRVALGHTGRPLVLPRGASIIYGLISAAALLRLGAAFDWLDYRWSLLGAGFAWILAFALFLAWFAPILASPRPDGRPG